MRSRIGWALLLCAAGAACNSGSPTAAPRPLPTLALAQGGAYFVIDGTPRLLMSRNITGESVTEIDTLLEQAAAAGDTLIRFHLMHGLGAGVTSSGAVDPGWASEWDAVFDHANTVGLYVAPVFGVWADWNDGTPDYGFANWSMNPWNTANGGPASDPSELWQEGSAVRTAWLAWVKALVDRWQARPNIAAWEVFSEVDIASGVDETSGAAFAADAAAVVRAADGAGRPIMASLTALNDWPTLSASGAVDILQVHTYADPLDTVLLSSVAGLRAEYGKPVLIGESGLSATAPTGGTATTAPNAGLEIRHAIWAGAVSGAMNARGLWWEDGYAIYEPPGLDFVNSYASAEAIAARFVSGIDFTAAAPIAGAVSPDLVGATVGSATAIVGWYRSVACATPGYACTAPLMGETVAVSVPPSGNSWSVTFVDPATGDAMPGGGTLTTEDGVIVVSLPTFSDDIAFTMAPAGG